MQVQDYYQLGGFMSDFVGLIPSNATQWKLSRNNLHETVNALGFTFGSITLTLGLKHTGASYLLIPSYLVNPRSRLLHRNARTKHAADFTSLSPITFRDEGELYKKLEKLSPKRSKAHKRDTDTSAANSKYVISDASYIPPLDGKFLEEKWFTEEKKHLNHNMNHIQPPQSRSMYEHSRLLWDIMKENHVPHTYTSTNYGATSHSYIRILVLGFTVYYHHKNEDTLNDVSWATVLVDPLDHSVNIQNHCRLVMPGAETRTIPVRKGGTLIGSKTIDKEWDGDTLFASSKNDFSALQKLFEPAVLDLGPNHATPRTLLICHDVAFALHLLRDKAGVDTTKWEFGLKTFFPPPLKRTSEQWQRDKAEWRQMIDARTTEWQLAESVDPLVQSLLDPSPPAPEPQVKGEPADESFHPFTEIRVKGEPDDVTFHPSPLLTQPPVKAEPVEESLGSSVPPTRAPPSHRAKTEEYDASPWDVRRTSQPQSQRHSSSRRSRRVIDEEDDVSGPWDAASSSRSQPHRQNSRSQSPPARDGRHPFDYSRNYRHEKQGDDSQSTPQPNAPVAPVHLIDVKCLAETITGSSFATLHDIAYRLGVPVREEARYEWCAGWDMIIIWQIWSSLAMGSAIDERAEQIKADDFEPPRLQASDFVAFADKRRKEAGEGNGDVEDLTSGTETDALPVWNALHLTQTPTKSDDQMDVPFSAEDLALLGGDFDDDDW